MKRALLLLAAFVMAPNATYAEAIVDQVERLDVDAGESEWELQTIYADATDDEESAFAANLSGEFGVSERVALGFELESGRVGGEGLDAEMLALQLKFVALDPASARVGLGAQVSLGRAVEGNETELEVRLLAETRFAGLAWASDITLETPLLGEEAHDVEVRYAARIEWAREWGEFGLEAGGKWGTLNDLRWSGEDRHWIGALIGVELSERVCVEAGYFAGLSDATPESQFRIELAVR